MATGAPVTARHVQTIVGAFLIMIAGSAAMSGLSFITSPVIEQFGFPAGQYGLNYAIMSVAMAFAMVSAGRRLKQVGPRNLLVVGGALSSLALLGLAFSFSLIHFYLAAAVLGVGFGLWTTLVPFVLVESWVVRSRGLVLGVVLAGSGIGALVWSLALPTLVEARWVNLPVVGLMRGWQLSLCLMAAVVALATILPAVFLITDLPSDLGLRAAGDDGSPRPGLSYRQASHTIAFLVFLPVLFLLGLVQSLAQVLVPWLNTLVAAGALPSIDLAVLLVGWSIGLLVLKPAVGLLADTIGVRWAAPVALLPGAVGWALLPLLTSLGTVTGGAVMMLAVLAVAACHVLPALMVDKAFGTRDFGRVWGTLGTSYLMGHAVGVPLWGFLRDASSSIDPLSVLYGYNAGFYLAPLLVVLAMAGASWALTRGLRETRRLERVREAEVAVALAAQRRREAERAARH